MTQVQFFAPSRSSWIETDFQILSRLAKVHFVEVKETSFLKWLFQFPKYELAYFWFGSFRHFPYIVVAKLLGKKIVVVAGGYDVNNMPEINYGAFAQSLPLRMLRRLIFGCADRIITVSDFAERMAQENLRLNHGRIMKIYLPVALPNTAVTPWSQRRREVVFLMSADRENKLVKGIDYIPEICRRLPDVKFKLAGHLTPEVLKELENENLSNFEFVGLLPFHSKYFFDTLNNSRVICGPSRCESFGAALLDGALLGCRPVAFGVGSVPEILEGIGTIVPFEDFDAMALAIRQNLDLEDYSSEPVVAHIKKLYSPEVREEKLRDLLADLV